MDHQENIKKAMESVLRMQSLASKSYWKPRFHLSPPAFWTNDPNGFVYYQDRYHLFYQHNPYGPEWGSIHWGHASSSDLAHWKHHPIALAPSEDYDRDGVFSGSAIEKDGKLWLMYTGNQWTGTNYDTDLRQFQCLAVSEDGGITFNKIDSNPVISEAPVGDIHPFHFRDPKVWKHQGHYYCVLGSRTMEHAGQFLLYRSVDLLQWDFIAKPAGGNRELGFMWECPDLFKLDDFDVLVFSPQGMKPNGHLYRNLHQSGYLLGRLDDKLGKFEHGEFRMLDYGFDFYAPQTMEDPQGRRIMIAWMAMWDSKMPEQEHQWAGAMTIPRELKLQNGQLISIPVPELQKLRTNGITICNVEVNNEMELAGTAGDCMELEVCIDSRSSTNFGLKLRCDTSGNEETVLMYDKITKTLTLDRDRSGKGPGGKRTAPVELINGRLKLQIFIDRSSVEIFIQEGIKTMTARIYPQETSVGIRFFANESIMLEKVSGYHLEQSVESGFSAISSLREFVAFCI